MISTRGKHAARLGGPFNALWLGQTVSQFGDYIAYFTVPAFVLGLSNRATDFTNIYAAESLPTLIFGFAGGVIIDRLSRRRLAVATDILRALAFLLLAMLAADERLEIWMLVALSFVIGTLAAAFNSALMSFVPSVVEPQLLAIANGRLVVSQQIAFATGPVIGAAIVSVADFPTAFLINSLTFVVSALSLLIARPRTRQLKPEAEGFLAQLIEGLRFIWQEKVLRYSVIALAVANLVTAFVEATLVLLGQEVFGIPDLFQIGIVFGGLGAGGVVGALTASGVIRRLGLGRTAVSGILLFGVGLLAMAVQRQLLVVAMTAFVGFIGLPWLNVSIVTIRQKVSPDELLGRVTAASRAIAWGSLPVGAMASGYLADRVLDLKTLTLYAPMLIILVGLALIPTVVWRTR